MHGIVFLSYARADSEFALRLAQDLRSAGVALWVDQIDLQPGDTWDRKVEEALQNSAGLLVILSPSSLASRSVMDEVSFALDEGKSVFPVLYQKCQIPFRLRRLQYTDFTSDYSSGLSKLIRALGRKEKPLRDREERAYIPRIDHGQEPHDQSSRSNSSSTALKGRTIAAILGTLLLLALLIYSYTLLGVRSREATAEAPTEAVKILFTTRHGELSLGDHGTRGLSSVRKALAGEKLTIEEWDPSGTTVPKGTDVVVVAGPTGRFARPELEALSTHLDRGGSLLVLLDPNFLPEAGSGLVQTGLEEWLLGLGIQVGQNIVVDPSNTLPFFGPETLFTSAYDRHSITNALAQSKTPVLINTARSISLAAREPGTELLRTSSESWGETNLAQLERVERDPSDIPGPIPLAVAVGGGEKTGGSALESELGRRGSMRIVVFGDSDFVSNQILEANPANSVLLSSTLRWLTRKPPLELPQN